MAHGDVIRAGGPKILDTIQQVARRLRKQRIPNIGLIHVEAKRQSQQLATS